MCMVRKQITFIFAFMSKQAITSYPKDRINILFLENISEKAVQQFHRNGYTNVKRLSGALSEDELIKEIKEVHLLGIRSKSHISAKVLAAAQIRSFYGWNRFNSSDGKEQKG